MKVYVLLLATFALGANRQVTSTPRSISATSILGNLNIAESSCITGLKNDILDEWNKVIFNKTAAITAELASSPGRLPMYLDQLVEIVNTISKENSEKIAAAVDVVSEGVKNSTNLASFETILKNGVSGLDSHRKKALIIALTNLFKNLHVSKGDNPNAVAALLSSLNDYKTISSTISDVANELLEKIKPAIDDLKTWWGTGGPTKLPLLPTKLQNLKSILNNVINNILKAQEDNLAKLASILDIDLAILSNPVDIVKPLIDLSSGIVHSIKNVIDDTVMHGTASKLEKLPNTTLNKTDLIKIVDSLKSRIPTAITEIEKSIQAPIQKLKNSLGNTLENIDDLISSAISGVSDDLKKVLKVVLSALVNPVKLTQDTDRSGIEAFKVILNGLCSFISYVIDNIQKIVTSLLGSALNILLSVLENGFTTVAKVVDKLIIIKLDILKELSTFVAKLIGKLISILSTRLNADASNVKASTIIKAVLNLFEGVLSDLAEKIKLIIDKVIEGSTPNSVKVLSNVMDLIGNIVKQIGDFLDNLGGDIANAINSLIPLVGNDLTNIEQLIQQVASNLTGDTKQSWNTALKIIVDAVKSIEKDNADELRKALSTFSSLNSQALVPIKQLSIDVINLKIQSILNVVKNGTMTNEALIELLGNMKSELLELQTKIPIIIKKLLQGFEDEFVNLLKLVDNTTPILSTLNNLSGSILKLALYLIQTAVRTIIGNLKSLDNTPEMINNIVSSILAPLKTIKDSIVNVITNLINKISSSLENIESVIDDVNDIDISVDLKDNVKNVLLALVKDIKRILGDTPEATNKLKTELQLLITIVGNIIEQLEAKVKTILGKTLLEIATSLAAKSLTIQVVISALASVSNAVSSVVSILTTAIAQIIGSANSDGIGGFLGLF